MKIHKMENLSKRGVDEFMDELNFDIKSSSILVPREFIDDDLASDKINAHFVDIFLSKMNDKYGIIYECFEPHDNIMYRIIKDKKTGEFNLIDDESTISPLTYLINNDALLKKYLIYLDNGNFVNKFDDDDGVDDCYMYLIDYYLFQKTL